MASVQLGDKKLEVHEDETPFVQAFTNVMAEQLAVMLKKRRLRGTGNISRQGLAGVVNRLAEDKMSRVLAEVKEMELERELKRRGVTPDVIGGIVRSKASDESLRDDFIDIANYSAICVMLMDGSWG